MPIIRPTNGARRSAAVQAETAAAKSARDAAKGQQTALATIKGKKATMNPNEVRDAVADVAGVLEQVAKVL